MSGLSFLLSAALGVAIATAPMALLQHLALRRIYRYCTEAADYHTALNGVADPVASAYSDMATVVTLGGRCEQRHELRTRTTPPPATPTEENEE